MTRFRVRWMDRAGEIHSREREAETAAMIELEYQTRGDRILDIRPVRFRGAGFRNRVKNRFNHTLTPRLTHREVHQLFYELGVILTAGVPILVAVGMLRREPHRIAVEKFLGELESGLKQGGSLSDLLVKRASEYDFARIVPILRMGERTGRLGESCRTVARNLDQWLRIQAEISSSLIYPAILTATGLAAVYMLMVYVIPRFKDVLAGFQVTLPWYARVLFRCSEVLSTHHDVIIGTLILLLTALLFLLRRPGFRDRGRQFVNRLPVIRNIRFAAENVRFVSALSHLLEGGVPILPTVELAAGNFSDRATRIHLDQVTNDLKRGRRLGESMEDIGVFPSVMTNMIRVGEESGTLAGVSAELRDLLSRRFLLRMRRIMSLLEPLIILLVAGFVALLVLSVLPIITNLGVANG